MQKLQEGRIRRLTDGKNCDYSIVTDANDIFPKLMNQTWQTILFKEARQLKSTATSKEGFIDDLCSHGITDFHWDWERIVSDFDINDYQQRTFYE